MAANEKLLSLLAENNIALPPHLSGRFYKEYEDTKHTENRIKFWLSLDEWTRNGAAFIFLDLQPDTLVFDSTGTLSHYKSFSGNFDIVQDIGADGLPIPIGVDNNGFERYLTREQENLIFTLDSMANDNIKLLSRFDRASPKKWIDLALEKKISIPWIRWAKDYGFYSDADDEAQITKHKYDGLSDDEVFDLVYGGNRLMQDSLRKNKDYKKLPIELDYALKAWLAVSNSDSKKKPKSQIRAWLDANAKELSNEAKERISIVANWDKLGGATRTD